MGTIHFSVSLAQPVKMYKQLLLIFALAMAAAYASELGYKGYNELGYKGHNNYGYNSGYSNGYNLGGSYSNYGYNNYGYQQHSVHKRSPLIIRKIGAVKLLTISHLNYFMDHHFSTKEQKLENLHVMKKTKKKLYLLSVQLCLVRCEKNPEPRFSRERIKKKKKKVRAPPFPSKKKSTSLAFFLSERKNK